MHEENLLDLLADPDVPRARIKNRLLKLSGDRARLTDQLSAVSMDLSEGAKFLETSLALLADPWDLYRDASDEVRRRLSQAIFERIYIRDEDVDGMALVDPFDRLFAAEAAHDA